MKLKRQIQIGKQKKTLKQTQEIQNKFPREEEHGMKKTNKYHTPENKNVKSQIETGEKKNNTMG